MRRALIAALGVGCVAAACASPGQPTGGPEDRIFPKIIAILPESNAVNAKPNRVLVRFDDVIAEQGPTGDLSKAVLVSPWDGAVDVAWRRTGLAIRPSRGWRPNTPYTITILPGIADLRNNRNTEGLTFRFSTGPTLPNTTVRGVVFDWTTGRILPRALVQLLDRADTTLAYVTASDSTGRFVLRTVPPGRYLVRGVEDKTPNRRLDPREAWDSVGVVLADSATAELYLFPHDTTPPRISQLEQRDSVTLLLTFDRPLAPGLVIDTALVRIVGPDSLPRALREVVALRTEIARQTRADSLAAARDTTRRPRRTLDPTQRVDTTTRAVLPTATRPPLETGLVVRTVAPFAAGTNYRITVTGARGVLGPAAPVSRTLVVPRAPTDSTAAPRAPARAPTPRDTTTRPQPAAGGAPARRAPESR
ncbi:MAG: Ig-like domain-containing protein [Gemmatimonadaceae bacterium]|nr:Ig-like domain-containing protein [Gemmatimonadaceae bacterium]